MALKTLRKVLRLEAFDQRVLPSVSMTETGGTLVIKGDQAADSISVRDDGTSNPGNIVVLADGDMFVSQGAISNIRIVSAGGADNVDYNLMGDLASPRTVVADLGNGDDVFTANANFVWLTEGASLTIRALGGSGKDQLGVSAMCNVLEGASLTVAFQGGDGADSLQENFSGFLTGTASFRADGGNGRDTVGGNLTVFALSDGEGDETPSTGTMSAIFRGNADNDAMTLHVTGTEDLTSLVARLNGGKGKDSFDATANVTIIDPRG